MKNKSYVYILISLKDKKRYIGSTSNLKQRLIKHNSGQVRSTKHRRPLKLFAYQECESLSEARYLEYKYKRSRGNYENAIKLRLIKVFRL